MKQSTRIGRGRVMAVLVALVVVVGATGRAVTEEPAEGSPVKQIKMTVENWKWTPRIIRVPVGTLVRLKVMSYDATHRFDLKAYGLKVNLPEDKTTTIEFLADKVGEFKWKCGRPCGNGCAKMLGKLIVEEPGADS